ncbi:MAG: RIP metalloprotease RseP [Lachnospiraceae bacterium]|nr:RIP metalloprotease RseP [Lachnospiraceae bacterium]
MSIVIALLVFSVIILFHEFGHFLLAKLNKITVVEFSLGMGPRLLSFEAGGTRYSWKLLPFGGSCMMLGEDGEEEEEGSFGSKSVWARMSVIAAGPIFNFLLAFIMALFIVGNLGYDVPVLLNVTEGMPAADAGLQAGDRIVKMNGKRIHLYREVQNYSMFHQGETVVFQYERDGELHEATVAPELMNGSYKYGIGGNINYRQKTNVLETLEYSAYEVYYWIDTTVSSLGLLFKGGVQLDDMSGPVGVVDAIGTTYQESRDEGAFYVWMNLLNIAILLSANLGVMNLLPIPALDGGRLIFLIVEAIRRKRVEPELEAKIHFAGLMLLMLLMVVVMFNDVKKLIL